MKKNIMRSSFDRFKLKVKSLKKEVKALYLAYKRPDVPWYAKALIILVVGYALSPVDLIPDFVPVLGYLDDFVLIPLGVSAAIKLIPSNVMAECRKQSEDVFASGKPRNWVAGGIIILLWVAAISLIIYRIAS